MKDLLPTVIDYVDTFVEENNAERLTAIIGGRAVIQHGFSRLTVDTDVLLFCGKNGKPLPGLLNRFVDDLKQQLGDSFDIAGHQASKDITDPLKHDIIIIQDRNNAHKKLDILFVRYKWELEGLESMPDATKGHLKPLPKPYLIGMKLMAGGGQDHYDVQQLFKLMSEEEKDKAYEIAKLIRRDKNLDRILNPKVEIIDDSDLETI